MNVSPKELMNVICDKPSSEQAAGPWIHQSDDRNVDKTADVT